jgi:antitoxin MazE
MITRTRIIRIGNSKGIRLPKMLLEQAQLPDEVELQAEHGRLIVRAARGARTGWSEAAKVMRARGEGQMLDQPTSSEFDGNEWRWR